MKSFLKNGTNELIYKTQTDTVFENKLWLLKGKVVMGGYVGSLGLIYTHWASLVAQLLRVCVQCGRPGFDPWVGKIPQRREWVPTPVFLPGEFHGEKSLVSYHIAHMVAKSWTRLRQLSTYTYAFNVHNHVQVYVVQWLSRVRLFAPS